MADPIQDSYYIQDSHLYRSGRELTDLRAMIPAGATAIRSNVALFDTDVLMLLVTYIPQEDRLRHHTRVQLLRLPLRPDLPLWFKDYSGDVNIWLTDDRGHAVLDLLGGMSARTDLLGLVRAPDTHHPDTWVVREVQLPPDTTVVLAPDGFLTKANTRPAQLHPYDEQREGTIVPVNMGVFDVMDGATSQDIVVMNQAQRGGQRRLSLHPRTSERSSPTVLSETAEIAMTLGESVIWRDAKGYRRYLGGKVEPVSVPEVYIDSFIFGAQEGAAGPILILGDRRERVAIQGGQIIEQRPSMFIIHERPSWRTGLAILHATMPAALARYIGRAI